MDVCNGVLTLAGTHNGKPYFRLPSGTFVYWYLYNDGFGYTFPRWLVSATLDDQLGNAYAVMGSAADTPVGSYIRASDGMPEGSIS